jgi:hypothetical protein
MPNLFRHPPRREGRKPAQAMEKPVPPNACGIRMYQLAKMHRMGYKNVAL